MSKQELKKWENKFKLYKALHPGQWMPSYCGKCPVLGKKNCSTLSAPVLMLTQYGEITCILFVEGMNGKNGVKSCVEWLKHE